MRRSTMAGSTLEIDSGHKNKKTAFYPKCVRTFLRILCIVDDSIYACRRNCSVVHSQLFGRILYIYSNKHFNTYYINNL